MKFISIYLKPIICIVLCIFNIVESSAQSCTVNAGGNSIVCGSTTTLNGGISGSYTASTPTWTFISGPTTPTIVSPNSFTTNVTGMIDDGNYVFQLSHPCNTGTATSLVTITAHPRPASFTAGADVTDICATIGTTNLSGVIPAGFTGTWRSVNIYSLERFNSLVSTNSGFSSSTSATPTFSIFNKSNHEIDPAYFVILRITSLDNVCSYEDTAIVRFIPNPEIISPLNFNQCRNPLNTRHWIDLSSTSPAFSSNYIGSAGTIAAGTIVSLDVINQPIGANLAYEEIETRRVFLTGMNIDGTYEFTLTVANECDTHTTPTISYTYSGTSPRRVNFVISSQPEQSMVFSTVGSGGELHCSSKIGSMAAETFYFDIDPLDPSSVISSVTPTGIFPPGGAPSVTLSGAGTYNRMATVTPPSGGWQAGTYKFLVATSNGTCSINQSYFIHVSDNNRPDVGIPNQSICYPGTGAISATIPLPDVYKQEVNTSYFQDFNAHYNFSVVSKPAGSANPVYTPNNQRTISNTSTIISNLDRAGDYVFQITAVHTTGGVGPFLQQEYSCSGASLTSQFTLHVENPVNANAGSNQNGVCAQTVNLLGNSPGAGNGEWTLVSAPLGAMPTIASSNSFSTVANNLDSIGFYHFEWTITSPLGGCVSSDEVVFQVICSLPTEIDISGFVFHDSDGMTGGVDGIEMQGVKVILFAADGITVIDSTTTDANGLYSFENVPYTVEDYIISVVLPSGFVHVSSTDSTPTNGLITVSGSRNNIDINFGIQQPPIADEKEFTIGESSFTINPPTGYPYEYGYKAIPMSSTALTGYSTGGSLSGSDPEDCPTTSSCNTGTGTTFNIETINSNTKLFYDFGGATGVQEINVSGGAVSIENFDVANLVIYGQTGSGTLGNEIGFTYSITDAAGATSSPVSYSIETITPLPVKLISFDVKLHNTTAILLWQTASEQNNKGFEIQRSTDSKEWIDLGFVKSLAENGFSMFNLAYEYTDLNPQLGDNYYRLKQIDYDGKIEYSVIRMVNFEGQNKGIVFYPNPTEGTLNISGLTGNNLIRVIDNIGRIVLSEQSKQTQNEYQLDLSSLPEGLYYISIINDKGGVVTEKIQKL